MGTDPDCKEVVFLQPCDEVLKVCDPSFVGLPNQLPRFILAGMKNWTYAGQTYDCPCVLTMDLIKGRWKTNILWLIWVGKNRFNEICRQLPQVNRGVIARQLRALERDGIIRRIVVDKKSLHVEYHLTAIGHSLEPVFEVLAVWGTNNGHETDLANQQSQRQNGRK